MNVIFVRHGEAWNNLPNARELILEKGPDSYLTDRGRAQAQRVGAALAARRSTGAAGPWETERRIEVVYSSLMIRAVQTGAAIADACDVPHIGVPILHEGGGLGISFEPSMRDRVFPGADEALLQSLSPGIELSEPIAPTGWWRRSYEDRSEWAARARRIVEWIKNLREHDTVCVVTHGDIFGAIMRELVARGHEWSYPLVNTGRTRVYLSEPAVSLVYHNRFDHLSNGLSPEE